MSKNLNKDEKGSYYRGLYGRTSTAIIMIFVGMIFLLINFGILPRDALSKFWPVFIIIPGIFMLLNQRK